MIEKLPSPNPLIYFVGTEQVVKVGFAANVARRVNELQVANFEKLNMLAWLQSENTKEDEKTIHRRWQMFKKRGEWFERNERIDFVINYLATYAPFPTIKTFFESEKQFNRSKEWKRSNDPEDKIRADAATMLNVDLFNAERSINSIHMREGLAYYRSLLAQTSLPYHITFDYSRKEWVIISSNGKRKNCLSYFESTEYFLYLKPRVPLAYYHTIITEAAQRRLQPNHRSD